MRQQSFPNNKLNEDGPRRWKLKEAEMQRYQTKCKKRLHLDANSKDLNYFTETLLAMTKERLPKRQRADKRKKKKKKKQQKKNNKKQKQNKKLLVENLLGCNQT